MIKIMVDSASDCEKDSGLFDMFVPLAVNIEGKEYRGGIDIDSDTFYSLLVNTKTFPRTSQPAPDAFLEHFEKVKAAGDELIYFALSSTLSGTYQSAVIAKSMVEYEGIHIIDTKTATHLVGILAEYASKLIKQGLTVGEIVEKCESLKSRIKVFAGLDTLEYLYRGGRLSKASAAVGEIAGIKPVVTVTEQGEVSPVGKALGCGRAMQQIVEKLKASELDEEFPVFTLYTCGVDNCEKLEKKLAGEGYNISARKQIGSVIGAHIGPEVYAVAFVIK